MSVTFFGWVWVSVMFSWLGVDECGLFFDWVWVGVGDCDLFWLGVCGCR